MKIDYKSHNKYDKTREFIRVSDIIRQSNKRSIVRPHDIRYASKILYPNNPEYIEVGNNAVIKMDSIIGGKLNRAEFKSIATHCAKDLNVRLSKGSIVYLSAILELIHFYENLCNYVIEDSEDSEDSD
tara:strand:+ start:370 stop:753 length:384 start_codon:yes stop_codon:yes gene_type:complete